MRKFVLATVLALASTGALAKDLSVIRFGVDPTFAPFESKNADGELVGFDIDLGNAICAQLKAKCVWVETAFDSIIPALRAKKFDGVLSAMTVNEKRKQNVAFSDRLYNSPNRLIAKRTAACCQRSSRSRVNVSGLHKAPPRKPSSRPCGHHTG